MSENPNVNVNGVLSGATNGAVNGVSRDVVNGAMNGVSNGVHEEEPVDISVALGPNDLKSVPGLIKDIVSASDNLSAEDSVGRLNMLAKARDLVRALETPRETVIKHCWAQLTCLSALVIGIEIGLFNLMVKNGGSVKKAEDMAKIQRIDPPLLCRLMCHMAAMDYITEVAADEYQPTNFVKSLTIPIISDGYPCVSGVCMAALTELSPWLAKRGWQTPNSVSDGPYQAAFNTKLNFFEWLQSNPPYGMQFNHHMGGYRQGRPAWMDPGFYPVQERLVAGVDAIDPNAVLLVDIGGSIGHDLDEFRRKHPDASGRLVLQDLPVVIGQIDDLDVRIERMTYDFHTEQPVVGARAYYMHSCLHDWPDEVCASILARVTAAMKPGYSRLLINENVIPAVHADWQATALDIMMMSVLSSRERTEADWYRLLEGAGLRIMKIWSTDKLNGVESLIECELN